MEVAGELASMLMRDVQAEIRRKLPQIRQWQTMLNVFGVNSANSDIAW
jgi:hypothetical protein